MTTERLATRILSVLAVLAICANIPSVGVAQQSSPTGAATKKAIPLPQAQAENSFGESTISFPCPSGTVITTQFQTDGIIFGGASPFTTTDKDFDPTLTQCVLSGTPLFEGEITGKFVDPQTGQPATVPTFTLEAGYFNTVGSTLLTWYDRSGAVLGNATNSTTGFEIFSPQSEAGIASWSIQIIGSEPNGFAVDTLAFPTPVTLYLVDPFLVQGASSGTIQASEFLANIAAPLNFQNIQAGGLVADGMSADIVVAPSPARASVTFTATNGAIILPYDASFLTKPAATGTKTLTVQQSQLVQYGSSYYAVAIVQSPPIGTAPDYTQNIQITAQAGSAVDRASILVIPPPILLVHGLWGNLQSLSYVQSSFEGVAPWSTDTVASAVPPVVPVCYSLYLPFDASNDPYQAGSTNPCEQTSQDAIQKATANLYGQLDSLHISGGRIDLIGHSMGGLVARHYTAIPSYWSSIRGRQQGLFREIVTLDTPEQGSALATYLLTSATRTYQSSCTVAYCTTLWTLKCFSEDTLFTCMDNIGMPISHDVTNLGAGAVASLQPSGASILNAPAPTIANTKWFAVGAVFPETGTQTSLLRRVLNSLLAGTYAKGSTTPTLTSILGNVPNDVIVTQTSQLSGNPAGSKVYQYLAHSSVPGSSTVLSALSVAFSGAVNYNVTQSAGVAFLAQCWLKTGGNSSCPNQIGADVVPSPVELTSTPDSDTQEETGQSKPIFVADERISILPLEKKLSMTVPGEIPVRVMAGTISSFAIEQSGKHGKDNGNESDAEITRAENGITYLRITPMLLGTVKVEILAHFTDGAVARQEVSVDVEPPSTKPLKFQASDFGTVVLTMNKIKEQFLLPRARYAGFKAPFYLDPQYVTFSVNQPENDPVVEVDSQGLVKALRSGTATVTATYGGVVDKVRVIVKDEGE